MIASSAHIASDSHQHILPQRQGQRSIAVIAASASASAPSVERRTRRSQSQQQQQQQQQQQPWASNDCLWRQSIQHKHAQRRRRQQLNLLAAQQLNVDPQTHTAELATPSGLQPQKSLGHQQLQSIGPNLLPAHTQQLATQQQTQQMQTSFEEAPARALTSAIGAAADAGQLLLLLSAQQQLDAIHVAAAVNQCARGLILDLQLPADTAQQHHFQQDSPAQLQWLCRQTDSTIQQQLQLWLGQQQQQPHAHIQYDGSNMQQQQTPYQSSLSVDWLLLLLLCQLVQQHAASMAERQLCTCLGGFTQLLQQHTHIPLLLAPGLTTACQELLLRSHTQLRQFGPRGLSLVLHSAAGIACSQGGLNVSPGFMLSWYRASRVQLQQFSYLDLSMCAGALGRMQLFPPAEWMELFWSSSKAALPTFPVHELLLLLLGVAGTRRPPPQAWLSAAMRQLQPSLPHMSPAQLSTAAMVCGKLNHVPSTAWLSGFWVAWEAQQPGFTARSHATVLWGMGKVRPLKPDPAPWAKKLQAALQHAVAQATTAVAAVALQKIRIAAQQQQLIEQEQRQQQQEAGLVRLQEAASEPQHSSAAEHHTHLETLDSTHQQELEQRAPPTASQQQHSPQEAYHWQNSDLDGLQPQQQQEQQQQMAVEEQPQLLASASLLHPTDCAMSLYGLARLGPSCMDPGFPAFWLAQSRSQLVNMNSQELSMCLWALGKLRLLPPQAWLQQHLHCCASLAGCMTHKQLAMVLWGCAQLKYLPDVMVTAELLMSAAAQLPRFSPQSLALMVWSLGALRMRPNSAWMQLVVPHIANNLQSFDGQDLCGVLVGLYALGYHPGDAWLDRFTGILATKIHSVSPKHHQRIVAVLGAFGYSGEGKSFIWVLDPVAVAAMCDRRPVTRATSCSAA